MFLASDCCCACCRCWIPLAFAVWSLLAFIMRRSLRFLCTMLLRFWINDNINCMSFSMTRLCLWCCRRKLATSRHSDLLSTCSVLRMASLELWPSRIDLTSLRIERISSPLTMRLLDLHALFCVCLFVCLFNKGKSASFGMVR